MVDGVSARLAEVQRRVAAAARRAGREPDAVTLVAVSKAHPAELVRAAARAGQTLFGENYVQELRAKREAYDALRQNDPTLPPVRWHFIGHLQRNKVRHLAGHVALVETVDSVALALELGRRAGGGPMPVLLQVNVGGEAHKSGVSMAAAPALAREVAAVPGVVLRGLMTIPPHDDDPERVRPHFRALRRLRDALRDTLGLPLPDLSMGMSVDYEVAVEEGATLVRVGTAIFGPRPARAEGVEEG